MNNLILAVLVIIVFPGCKNLPWNTVKSVVGLDAADKYQNQIQNASSFVQLGVWFKSFKIDNSVPADLSSSLKTPAAYQQGLIAYVKQQLAILDSYQNTLNLTDENLKRTQIKELLKNETLQMQDIILTLIDKNHNPDSGDLFAFLLWQTRKTNYKGIDLFAQKYLASVFRDRPIYSIANAASINQERINYQAALENIYLAPQNGLAQLKIDIDQDRLGLFDFLQILTSGNIPGKVMNSSVRGAPAAFLAYNKNVMDTAASGNLTQDQEKIDFKQIDFLTAADLASASSTSPNPTSSSTPNLPIAPSEKINNQNSCLNSSTGAIDQVCLQNTLAKILNPNWQGNNSFPMPKQATNKINSSISCGDLAAKNNFDDEALVLCERRKATLNVDTSKNKGLINDLNSGLYIGESGDRNMKLIAFSGNVIDNQGQEGSCTAHGLTHAVMTALNFAAKSNDLSFAAIPFWQTYSDPVVSSALDAAEKYNWPEQSNGKNAKVTQDKALTSLSDVKAAIDSSRPVYAASKVGGDWSNASDGKITCDQLDGGSGHAYAILGYLTEAGKLYFAVKNSWGVNWGKQGFALLPADCTSNPNFEFEGYTLKATL